MVGHDNECSKLVLARTRAARKGFDNHLGDGAVPEEERAGALLIQAARVHTDVVAAVGRDS